MTIKAIETKYKGYRFRSRLEARWAVFFDAVGVNWEYEKEGFDLGDLGWYLPDFYLPKFRTWVEVKPAIPHPMSKDRSKLSRLVHAQPATYSGVFLGPIGETEIVGTETLFDDFMWIDIDVERHGHDFDDSQPLHFDAYNLVCPFCADTYVHCEPASNITGENGLTITIPAWCECGGHKWEMCLDFYKGETYVSIDKAKEHTYDFALILAGGQHWLREKAIELAKSARFEHGESGGA